MLFRSKKAGEGKSASSGRLVYDYRKLNSLVTPLNFPIATTKNVFEYAGQYKYFSVVDLKDAFSSIPLTERAKRRCAIITPFGIFLPQRSPFGLKSSPSAFLYAVNKALEGLDFAFSYMDDIVVCSNSEEEMCENLKKLFSALHKFNFKIQISKLKLFKTEIKILGVLFSKNTRKIDPDRIKSIVDMKLPTTVKETQRLLGCLAYLSSFIPHFSTRLFPVFDLLKGASKGKPFEMTQEAKDAISEIKDFLIKQTQLYNIKFDQPLYISTDASMVGFGCFVYQLDIYERTEENKRKVLADFGFIPDKDTSSRYLVPGVAPGKKPPLVTQFSRTEEEYKKYDKSNSLASDLTMTQKLKNLENFIVIVRPVAFYSKLFTPSQIKSYQSMEKEFYALTLSLLHFRDLIESCPITYVLSDNIATLWALKNKDDSLMLSRYIIKLWELNINLVLVHLSGQRNAIADFLSRTVMVVESDVPNKQLTQSKSVLRQAMHITSSVPLLSVLSKKDIEKAFDSAKFEPCKDQDPELCRKNVNSTLFRGVGPFEYSPHVVQTLIESTVKKVTKSMEDFTLTMNDLNNLLSQDSIMKAQRDDKDLNRLLYKMNTAKIPFYFLKDDIIWRKFQNDSLPANIVIPDRLIPVVLAKYHLKNHIGPRKFYALLRKRYWWPGMMKSVIEFVRGCILCSINKSSTMGKGQFGEPLKISAPRKCWQIDILSGFPSVRGYDRILNIVDMFSGYSIPVPLRNDSSESIAEVLENVLIKNFGVPEKISSDNAKNLAGPQVRKLLRFFDIEHILSTPYRPESHSLVEISNRYITQSIRIFSDQFGSNWLDVVTLSALVVNSTPRLGLDNYSPMFLMFGRESFENESKKSTVAENDSLDIQSYVTENLNNHNFATLLYKYLLCKRKQQNEYNKSKMLSFPKNSLVYVKNHAPQVHKKIKPIYFKTPERIVKEYKSIAYTVDLYGRVKRRSKSDLKLASPRTIHLFGRLPPKLQVILGEPLNEKIWQEIKNTGKLPDYMYSLRSDQQDPILLRSDNIPKDQLNLDPDIRTDREMDELDAELIDETGDFLTQLKFLHSNQLLDKPNMTLKDVSNLYKNAQQNVVIDAPDPTLDNTVKDRENQSPPKAVVSVQKRNRNVHIDPSNIISAPRQRKVRFNLPSKN